MISRLLLSSSLLLLVISPLALPVPASAFQNGKEEKDGAILFRDKGCAYCHGTGAIGTKKAPALTDLWKDKSWTPEKITNQILNGGQKMPPFRDSVTDEEAGQLVAYLRAKNKPVPPPTTDDATQSSPQ